MKADLVIRGIGQMATLAGPDGPRRLAALGDLALVEAAALAACDGLIVAAGPERDLLPALEPTEDALWLDAGGALVTPGFVDPHTHALFGRYRGEEYAQRVAGAPYVEIAAAGGGIHASVSDFRSRSDDELLALSRPRLRRMIASGSTSIEIKSGYGLSLDEELRALRLISRLADELPVRIVPTFLGAHEVPAEKRGEARGAFIDEILTQWIPAVAESGLASYVDVFCEPTVFTLDESRRILLAAREAGLGLKIHADEIEPGYGGAALAADLGAASADHLIVTAADDLKRLAASDTIAVLLPATSLGLASCDFAPARDMVDAGVAVALATDFNPGSSCCESMGLVMSLACSAMRLSPAEALTASTHNAACACGLGESAGSLAAGKRADILIHDLADWRELPYHMGFGSVRDVIIGGQRIRFDAADLRDRSVS